MMFFLNKSVFLRGVILLDWLLSNFYQLIFVYSWEIVGTVSMLAVFLHSCASFEGHPWDETDKLRVCLAAVLIIGGLVFKLYLFKGYGADAAGLMVVSLCHLCGTLSGLISGSLAFKAKEMFEKNQKCRGG